MDYHSPRSVEGYIGTFEAVLIQDARASYEPKGITLIKHLRLTDEVCEDVNAIKKDLIKE